MARSRPKRKPADRSSARDTQKNVSRRPRRTESSAPRSYSAAIAKPDENKPGILPLEKSKGGRPPYEPDQKDRDFAIAMAAHGARQDVIARVLRISDVTLRKHLAYEIEMGLPRAHADVGHTLFMKSVGGPERDWRRADTTAAIFYAKTQMGWREPAKEIELGDIRIESLSDRQLEALLERIVARQRLDFIEGRAEAAEGERERSVHRLPS
jgi:hypothetical protein